MPRRRFARTLRRADVFIGLEDFDDEKLSQHADSRDDLARLIESQSLQVNEFFSMAWKLHHAQRAFALSIWSIE
jgi:hypothetical protein